MGFLKKLVAVVVLVAVAYAGYRWGPAIFPPVERALGLGAPESAEAPEPDGPTAELAEETLDRFEQLRRGQGDGRLVLGGRELSSVVRYAVPGIIPPGVDEPTVTLEDGRVQLSARVALAAFPRLPKLDNVLGLLPDTVPVTLEGSLVPLDQNHLALLVDQIQVSHIPLPRRMIPEILAGFGREGTKALPEDALAVPLPDGLRSVFVQRDSLVLVADR
jgi:hypothetical protein